MKLEYRTNKIAILTDWSNPYTDGIHGDWRQQVRYALSNPEYHKKLAIKLEKFAPFILVYSKILTEKSEILKMVGFEDATVCVISSSGEHKLTPWMIIHNIGHTIISWDIWIKGEIMDIANLSSHDDSIIPIQHKLVDTAASRNMLIPNLNEVIYELFTTWAWYGSTRSNIKELREYCDKTFPKLFEKYRNKIFWHQYRHPIRRMRPMPWLEDIVSNLHEVNYVPGVPGFTTKVLKEEISSSLEE